MEPTLATPRPRRGHPAIEDAKKFREGLKNNEPVQASAPEPASVQTTPVATASAEPVPASTSTSPVSKEPDLTPVLDIGIPDEYNDILAGIAPSSAAASEPVSSEPSVDYKQIQADNERLRKELEESRKQLEEAQKISSELLRFKDDRDLDELIKNAGIDYETIDPSDVKKIMSPLFQAIRQQAHNTTAQLQKQLQEQQDRISARLKQLDDTETKRKYDSVRAALLKAHPDLEQLQQSEAYKRAMLTPVGGNSGILTGQLVAAEYKRGNADYIIKVLNDIKQSTASNLESVASVPPSAGVAKVPPAPTGTSDYLTPEQLSELNHKVRTRQISREEFHTLLEKHRAAAKQVYS